MPDFRNQKRREKAERQRQRSFFAIRLNAVSFFEFIHTPAGIYKLLLAREIRMALRADINLNDVDVLGRTGHKSFAASALNFHLLIFRMNIRFHFITSLLSLRCASHATPIVIIL